MSAGRLQRILTTRRDYLSSDWNHSMQWTSEKDQGCANYAVWWAARKRARSSRKMLRINLIFRDVLANEWFVENLHWRCCSLQPKKDWERKFCSTRTVSNFPRKAYSRCLEVGYQVLFDSTCVVWALELQRNLQWRFSINKISSPSDIWSATIKKIHQKRVSSWELHCL